MSVAKGSPACNYGRGLSISAGKRGETDPLAGVIPSTRMTRSRDEVPKCSPVKIRTADALCTWHEASNEPWAASDNVDR